MASLLAMLMLPPISIGPPIPGNLIVDLQVVDSQTLQPLPSAEAEAQLLYGDGEPIVQPMRGEADEQGFIIFIWPVIDDGVYIIQVSVEAPGYQPQVAEGEVVVDGARITVVRFQLQLPTTNGQGDGAIGLVKIGVLTIALDGLVLDNVVDRPIKQEATITDIRTGAWTTSKAGGGFLFPNIVDRSMTLRVAAPGYRDATSSLSFSGVENAVDIQTTINRALGIF